MTSLSSAARGLNRLLKNGPGRHVRSFFHLRPVIAMSAVYNRCAMPLLRKARPLYGATVMVGLTYKCQCRCPHCGTMPYRSPGRRELSADEVLNLIRQAAGLGAGGLYLFGGEPMLAAGLENFVREARGLGMIVTLDTNGLLMDKAAARSLALSGLERVGVSVDSADEAEHDRLRGIHGAFRAAVKAIEYCRDEGLDVVLSTYATRESLRDGGLDRTIVLARSLGVRTRVLSSLRSGMWLERADVPFRPEDIAILRSKLAKDVYWESLSLTSPKGDFVCGCSARTHFYVSPYGEVQPCCYIPLAFGDVRSEPLDGIIRRMWSSPKLASLDAGTDCPMNSPRFREMFSGVFSRPGPGPHPAELAASPNDPKEWDEWAADYGRDVDWLEEIHNPDLAALAPGEGKKVLDAGCGTGRRALALFGKAAKLTAVDSSGGMVKTAKKILSALPQAEVLELDIEKGGLPAGEYDSVIAVSVMHHIRNGEAAVRNLKDSLAPGGTLVIVDAVAGQPTLTALRYYLEMLFRHSPVRLARAFLNGFFLNTRVARHKRREVPLAFEEFRRRYAPLLPGASVEVRHGIFAYLVWRKPAEKLTGLMSKAA